MMTTSTQLLYVEAA